MALEAYNSHMADFVAIGLGVLINPNFVRLCSNDSFSKFHLSSPIFVLKYLAIASRLRWISMMLATNLTVIHVLDGLFYKGGSLYPSVFLLSLTDLSEKSSPSLLTRPTILFSWITTMKAHGS